MILLAQDTGAVRLDVGAESVCICAKGYTAPQTSPGCLHLSASDFLAAPARALEGRTTLVVVGLNKIITPPNRTKVGPHLLRPRPGLRRISVDRTLFVSEPWRAWWHFGCVGAPYREYTYSYLAETHWNGAQDGLREDPFTLEAITQAGRGVIRVQPDYKVEPLLIQTIRLEQADHDAYAELKTLAFEEEHTAHAIVARLAAFAQERCPARRIPQASRVFDAPGVVVRTDLRVDDHLVGRLVALVDLASGIGAAFQ